MIKRFNLTEYDAWTFGAMLFFVAPFPAALIYDSSPTLSLGVFVAMVPTWAIVTVLTRKLDKDHKEYWNEIFKDAEDFIKEDFEPKLKRQGMGWLQAELVSLKSEHDQDTFARNQNHQNAWGQDHPELTVRSRHFLERKIRAVEAELRSRS